MKFSKVKYDGKKVELLWTEKQPGGTKIEHNLTSGQAPEKRFKDAIDEFVSFVREILELPAEYTMDGFRVTGVSTNEEEGDGRAGCVITSQKKLAATNAPLVINTPHLREPMEGDANQDGPGFFIAGMEEAIEELHTCARRYVDGEREQRDLFEEKKAA